MLMKDEFFHEQTPYVKFVGGGGFLLYCNHKPSEMYGTKCSVHVVCVPWLQKPGAIMRFWHFI
jgi:hypothetical protein